MRSTESVEETMTITNYNVVEIICNKCGDKDTEEDYDHERFQELSMSFGYGSRYDSEHWSFDLCDQCITDLIKTFKHVPKGFGEDSHFARYPQTMFENWKETEEINLEAGMTPEEIKAHGGSIYATFEEDEEE